MHGLSVGLFAMLCVCVCVFMLGRMTYITCTHMPGWQKIPTDHRVLLPEGFPVKVSLNKTVKACLVTHSWIGTSEKLIKRIYIPNKGAFNRMYLLFYLKIQDIGVCFDRALLSSMFIKLLYGFSVQFS